MAETALEALLDKTVRSSALAEPITYTPAGGAPEVGRGVFSRVGFDVDLNGVSIATDQPRVGLRSGDFTQVPVQDDQLAARGTTYRIVRVSPGGGSWVECDLHEV